MAKNAKSGLGRGLNSLLSGASEEARPVEESQNTQRIVVESEVSVPKKKPLPEQTTKREKVFQEEPTAKISEEISDDNIQIKSIVERKLNEVSLDCIHPNPDQPRTHFNKEELEELAASIEKDGLLQPLLVRSVGQNSYQIIAGERRWQACKMLNLKTVPIRTKDADDDKALELALIENIQRSDLNPIEEAYGYKRLMDRRNMTQSEVAQTVSKGRSTIANALRLLELPEKAQQLLFEEKITAGHARAILSIPSKEGRQTLTDKLEQEKLSVREAEAIARLLAGKKASPGSSTREPLPPAFKSVARALKEALHTNVKVKSSKGRNRIEIEFKDEEDLARLFEELTSAAS